MKTMCKFWLLLVVLGFAAQARAQETVIAGVAPVIEEGIGYTYLKSTVPSQGSLTMRGILLSGSADLNSHFGAKLAVGYSRTSDAFQTGRSADLLTYMIGPVFYPVRHSRFSIHVQALVGGARETGVNFESDGTLVRGYVHHLAWAGGMGFQYRISPGLSLRPEVEYLSTSYFDSTVSIKRQVNLRPALSLMYTFGRRE